MKLIPALAALALLTACGASDPAPAATVTVTATATPEPAPEPTSEAPADTEGALALGDTLTLSVATFRVLEVKSEDVFDTPTHGVKVEACNTGADEVTFSGESWLAVDADGGRQTHFGAAIGTDSFNPAYPTWSTQPEAVAMPGDCITGWMTFVDPQPVELRYRNAAGDSGVWRLA